MNQSSLPFDPADYDVFYVGVSGGKDSTALMLWAFYESGLPKEKLQFCFCDTSNEDALTYAYVALLSEKIAPINTLVPELGFYDLAAKHHRFPSRMGRFCTQKLKVIPSRAHVLTLLQGGKRVMLLNGVRKDEAHNGNDRGAVEAFGYDDGYAAPVYRPILAWSIEDVWAIHKRYLKLEWIEALIRADPTLSEELKVDVLGKMAQHAIPRNPLYDMGARRVGCFPCINSSKAEIRAMGQYRPERIEFIAEKERTVAPERGFSSMFVPKTVPARFRSMTWVHPETGATYQIATIHDVVAWSKTGARARGVAKDDEIELCDSAAGACE